MGRILIYVIFSVIVLFDQPLLFEGEYVRCYVKDCLSVQVCKLMNEKTVLVQFFMHGRKSREKQSGTWSSADSTIYFELSEDYVRTLSVRYKVTQWRDYVFLVAEKELLQWNVMIDKINAEFANDENLKFINGIEWRYDDEASRIKKKELLREWEIVAIQNAISDHDILIKRK